MPMYKASPQLTNDNSIQELIGKWDSERELLRSAPESYQIRWNNAK